MNAGAPVGNARLPIPFNGHRRAEGDRAIVDGIGNGQVADGQQNLWLLGPTACLEKAPNSPKLERMTFLARSVEPRLRQALAREKSVLLLGPRQTGKTTLLQQLKPDL